MEACPEGWALMRSLSLFVVVLKFYLLREWWFILTFSVSFLDEEP